PPTRDGRPRRTDNPEPPGSRLPGSCDSGHDVGKRHSARPCDEHGRDSMQAGHAETSSRLLPSMRLGRRRDVEERCAPSQMREDTPSPSIEYELCEIWTPDLEREKYQVYHDTMITRMAGGFNDESSRREDPHE